MGKVNFHADAEFNKEAKRWEFLISDLDRKKAVAAAVPTGTSEEDFVKGIVRWMNAVFRAINEDLNGHS